MKQLEKMMEKKEGMGPSEMSDQDIKAKMETLMELLEMAQKEMGHKVKSGMDEMQKVSVMAPDKKGLQEGLEKAQEIMENPEVMEKMEEMAGKDLDNDQEEGESEEHKAKIAEAAAEEKAEPASEEAEEDDDSLFKKKDEKKKKRFFDYE